MKILTKLAWIVATMVITAGSAFAAANINSVTVGAQVGALSYGTAGSVTFAVTAGGSGSGNVSWGLTNALPVGATAVFSPATSSGNGSWATTLTITSTNTTPSGTTVITVKGTGNGSAQNTNLLTIGKLTVTGVVAVDNKIYDRTTTATITNRSLLGAVGGDAVSLTGGAANFADKNVGAGKTVTVTNLSLTGAAAGSYTLAATTVTTAASITAQPLTVSATASNKVYNATSNATVSLSDDRISGDVLTASYGSAAFDDKNVGNGKNVSVTGINVTGTDAGNYTPNTTASTTANITAKGLLVSATGVDKTYDGTTNATVGLTDDKVVGDDVTPVYAAASFSDKNIGAGKSVSVIGINLNGTDAGNYTFNTTAMTTAAITAKSLTSNIQADNKVYDGTAVAIITNRFLTGVAGGDAVNLVAGTASFTNKNVGAGKTVTEAGLSLGGVGAGNYTLVSSNATTTASITARTLNVSATGVNKIYDGTNSATVTLNDDRVVGDVLSTSYLVAAFDDKNAGTNKNVSVTGIDVAGVDAGNYTFNTTTSTTAAISKKPVTATIAAGNKAYDGTATAVITNGFLTGGIGGEDVSLTGGSAHFDDKNVGNGKTVTQIGVGLGGADAGNYSLAATNATTTANITPLALTVTAAGVNKGYDGNATATVTLSDNRVAGDVITNSYGQAAFDDQNVGTNKHVSVTGISVTGADAGNYTFNTTAETTASILVVSLTVNIAADNKVYDGTDAATVTNRVLTGVIGLDDVSVVAGTAKFDDKNVGAGKTVTETNLNLTGAAAGNYALVSASATTTADITARALTVSAAGVNKVYDGTTNATVTLSDDRVLGDVLTTSYASASFASKAIGTNKPVSVSGINVTGGAASNYTFNVTASTTANITAVGLIGSITASNKVYDATVAATIASRTLTNVIGGDTVSLVGGSAAFTNKDVGVGKTVTAAGLSLSGADAGNYTLAVSNFTTTANITAATLTVTADDKARVYAAPDPALTVNYSGFVGGEGFAVLSGSPSLSTTATLNSPVSGNPYDIIVTNGSLSAVNYGFNFVNGHLTINPASSTNVVTSSANPVATGTGVTFTATLSGLLPSTGTPSGVVQFLVDGTPFGAPAPVSSGVAQLTTSVLAHGYHAISARYAGNTNFIGSTNSLSVEQLINTAPVATNDVLVANQNVATNVAASVLKANDVDPDGDTFNVTGVSAASGHGGAVSLVAGTVNYAPPSNYVGADSFTYTLTDLYGATAVGTVNVTVLSGTNVITRIVQLPDHNYRLTVTGGAGVQYVLQAASSLTTPVWSPIRTNTADISGQYTVDDLTATNFSSRYYRTVLP